VRHQALTRDTAAVHGARPTQCSVLHPRACPERARDPPAKPNPRPPRRSRQVTSHCFLLAISNSIRHIFDYCLGQIPRQFWENELSIFVGNRNQGWCHPVTRLPARTDCGTPSRSIHATCGAFSARQCVRISRGVETRSA
jgi:hypothetical protein